jgi:recombinational DNA repair protein (RecF pathway)
MGKCSVCGKKIQYNQYKIVKDKIYCSKCEPPKTLARRKRSGKGRKYKKIVKANKKAERDAKNKGLFLGGGFTPEVKEA